jgi:long-subunit acyl-CoA synthetase (AMP-forming)
VFEDIQVLRPTILPGVPVVFTKMLHKIMEKKDKKGGLSKLLFDWGYDWKKSNLNQGKKI